MSHFSFSVAANLWNEVKGDNKHIPEKLVHLLVSIKNFVEGEVSCFVKETFEI
jgi:hypothetical protein